MSSVSHPGHYGGADNVYEVIKVLEAWMTPQEFIGGLKFNILKYVARHRSKGGREDLAKAKFYQDYLDDFLTRTGADVGGKHKPDIIVDHLTPPMHKKP